MTNTRIDRWFAPLSHALVVASIIRLTAYMAENVGQGVFPLWPYPAFAGLVALLFAAYGVLARRFP